MRKENRISKVRYPFTKSLMFAKVMEDPELCREFIRRLFPNRKVEDVKVQEVGTVQTEATLIPGVYSKYIRLDVLFEDEAGWYNIEMQAAEQEGDFTKRLTMLEERKSLPAGAIWDYYCLKNGIAVGMDWYKQVVEYEKNVLSKR